MKYIGKCLFIEEENTIVIGDLHIGYEESLNESGVFVSRGMLREMKEHIDKVFEKSGGVRRVILIGDVKHEFGGNLKQEWNEVIELIDYLSNEKNVREIIVLRGNHDNFLKTIASRRNIMVEDYYLLGETAFVHGDRDFEEIHDKKIKCWVMGHAHPAILLSDGIKREKYKCFLSGQYKGKEIIIVPSFSEHVEGSDPREYDLGLAWEFDLNRFKVLIVGEGLEVMNFGELGKL